MHFSVAGLTGTVMTETFASRTKNDKRDILKTIDDACLGELAISIKLSLSYARF